VKSRPSVEKRRKELARQERQKDKAERRKIRREERTQEGSTEGISEGAGVELDEGTASVPRTEST
jgi:hypothetical protein